MATVNLSNFPLEKFNDHKYEGQADEYRDCIFQIDERLVSVKTELDAVDKVLGIDPESSKDMLSYHVIVSNKEIQDELEALCAGLDTYSSVMHEEGVRIDEEKAKEKQTNAINEEQARLDRLEAEKSVTDNEIEEK